MITAKQLHRWSLTRTLRWLIAIRIFKPDERAAAKKLLKLVART